MKLDFNKLIWIVALLAGAIAILGYYDLVTIKGLTKYNFEFLLVAYAVLLSARFMKK